VVEVEIVFLSADNALPFVALPDFQLHRRRNHPRVWKSLGRSGFYVEVLCQFELKFEDRANSVLFSPTVREPKKSVEGPDSRMNFFIDGYNFRGSLALFCLNRCLFK